MPLSKLVFKPGVNKDQTNYASEGGWYDIEKVRFRSGFPEKIGGWLKYGTNTFTGICRSLCNWITSDGGNLMGVATHLKVFAEAGGIYHDITPIRATFTYSGSTGVINTTASSSSVRIYIPLHGAETGDFVNISGVTGTVGGVAASYFNTGFQLTKYDTNNIDITIATTASSTATTSTFTAQFEIHVGYPVATYGYGWGVGTWSRGTWGGGATTPIHFPPRLYSQDNFYDDLIFNIRNGNIYYWTYDASFTYRASLLSAHVGAADVPSYVGSILFSQTDRHLIAFGGTNYGTGTYDPLLIRWADQDLPWVWTPTVTNSAGFLRASNGSQIVRAIRTRQEIAVLTDSALYSMQFLGTQDVFGLQQIADNISVAGPGAVTTVNNVVYWMGLDKFYAYSGRVETLPCTLRAHVFQNMNRTQDELVVSGTNEQFNEIIWFYCSTNSSEIDRYVIYNYSEGLWYYGTLVRTAWLDSPLRNYPMAAKTDGYLYEHEHGLDDDTLPMTAYIQSGDIDIEDGNQFMLVRRVIPDVTFDGSTASSPTVNMTISPRNFPGANYATDNAETTGITKDVIRTASVPVDQYTNEVFLRVRGRQISFKIASDALGVKWQLGMPRIDARPDGRKS